MSWIAENLVPTLINFFQKKKDQSFLETMDMDIIVYFADLSFDL